MGKRRRSGSSDPQGEAGRLRRVDCVNSVGTIGSRVRSRILAFRPVADDLVRQAIPEPRDCCGAVAAIELVSLPVPDLARRPTHGSKGLSPSFVPLPSRQARDNRAIAFEDWAMLDGSQCPHCCQSITPKPKRARDCPHCGGRIVIRQGQLLTPRQVRDELHARLREATLDQLASHRQIGIISALRIVRTEDNHCCTFCRSQHGRVIPLAQCSAKTLPPFDACTNPDGCRCFPQAVLR